MSSPAISRLDAAKATGQFPNNAAAASTSATANITTSTNPNENATAVAGNVFSKDPSLAADHLTVANAANVIEGAKQLAAFAAVDHHVLSHHKVYACASTLYYAILMRFLGHWNRFRSVYVLSEMDMSFEIFIGSTVPYVVDRIVQQGKEANANRVFIPTGMKQYIFPSTEY